ncbi:hypothetical protein GCM10020258_19060 [Sphingomonas yabuuchiae]
MARLFADRPEAVAESMAILERIAFRLNHISYQYPDEPIPQGWDAQDWLEELVRREAAKRYPGAFRSSCAPCWTRNSG